eukprot:g63137.t1
MLRQLEMYEQINAALYGEVKNAVSKFLRQAEDKERGKRRDKISCIAQVTKTVIVLQELGIPQQPFCLKRNVSVALPKDVTLSARVEQKARMVNDELVAAVPGSGDQEETTAGARLVPAAPEASSCEAEGIADGRVADELGPKLGRVDLSCAIVNQSGIGDQREVDIVAVRRGDARSKLLQLTGPSQLISTAFLSRRNGSISPSSD